MKTTLRALLSSGLALVICVSMLIGTTFAWFTDSATSANNKIQAGTLDIELYEWTDENTSSSLNETSDPVFGDDILWEPGMTQTVYFSIKNAGTLDLKYRVTLDVKIDNPNTNYPLTDVMSYVISPDAKFGDLQAWPGNGERVVKGYNATQAEATPLYYNENTEEGDEHFFALSIHMDEEAGNGYMGESITFDIKLDAAQLASEVDGFGSPEYDKDAGYLTPVASYIDLFTAIENGDDVELQNTIAINDAFFAALEEYNGPSLAVERSTVINTNAIIDGEGITISRTEETKDAPIFYIESGYSLTLSNITIDGGAIWTGETDPTLLRGTVNNGIVTTGALVSHAANSHLFLNEGAVLQNNDGANAVNLNTRAGATLTINGGEIINNHSAAGAIWGGGAIVMNSGKVNGNHGGIGGAIRVVTNVGTVLTMNGGEMNHNKSDDVGGAIWAGSSRSNNVYVLNGGEMAYNYSPVTGGAIYAGYYETVKISGTFSMHDNSCTANIGSAIRFYNHASLVMTGGEIYNHDDNAFYLNNNSATITGGKYVGNFGYSGGLGLTIGEADIDGVIHYNLGTNHHTAYLAESFNSFEFTVEAAHVGNFNFKPAAGYVYTEGDETKLICLNEGYSTYWDAATSTFKLQADAVSE